MRRRRLWMISTVRFSGRKALNLLAPVAALGLAAVTAWLAIGGEPVAPLRIVPIAPSRSIDLNGDAAPPPTVYLRLDPRAAELRNALLPYSHIPMYPGASFRADAKDVASLDCLTQAVYYEAATEPEEGKRAVAQVVINRLSSSPFPKTVCDVVHQGAGRPGCQFTFTCHESTGRPPPPEGWADARRIAADALNGSVDPLVGAATHYHADYVFPVWAPTMQKLVKIGRHIFYRWPGARFAPPQLPSLAAAETPLDGTTEPGAASLPGVEPFEPTTSTPSLTTTPIAEPPSGSDLAPRSGSLSPVDAASAPSASPRPGIFPSQTAPPVVAPRPSPPRRAVPEPSLRGGVG